MTVIYPSPIFGPVHSRRLGVSLGVNLLPGDGKCCSFDCIYCECGFNKDFPPHSKMPSREEVRSALEEKLKEMKKNGSAPDVLTFAGNGEPTMHPEFAEIMNDVMNLRDKFFPDAKVSVLTNATQIFRKNVFDTLCRVDNNIVKLDTVSPEYISAVDRPVNRYDVDAIVEQMKLFNGRCIVQTLFMEGEHNGESVSNTGEKYVTPWLETVKRVAPREVMIYTIDRETPAHGLRKASHETLDSIANKVREAGLKCQVSY